MADQKVKKYSPVTLSSDMDSVLRQFREAKWKEADAKARAEELRDRIMGACWRDEFAPMLQAGGFDGLDLRFSDGQPAVRVAVSFPVRFQGKELERDDPQLYARYKRQAEKPELRVTIVDSD